MRAVRPTVEAIGALWLGLVLFDSFQISRAPTRSAAHARSASSHSTPPRRSRSTSSAAAKPFATSATPRSPGPRTPTTPSRSTKDLSTSGSSCAALLACRCRSTNCQRSSSKLWPVGDSSTNTTQPRRAHPTEQRTRSSSR